jgi:hypothetical protein
LVPVAPSKFRKENQEVRKEERYSQKLQTSQGECFFRGLFFFSFSFLWYWGLNTGPYAG